MYGFHLLRAAFACRETTIPLLLSPFEETGPSGGPGTDCSGMLSRNLIRF
jgi:hypothetical protein